MSEIKLKPCPFCGGEAKIVTITTGENVKRKGYFCKCKTCGNSSFPDFKQEGTMDKWNNRKPMEQIVQQLNNRIEEARKVIVENPADKLDKIANDAAEDFIQAYEECLEIIQKGDA